MLAQKSKFNSICRLIPFVALMGFGLACASINETYYVAAYDPASGSSPNYYRIHILGNAGWSKLKYSIGYYDREAIERLFGEFSIQREYEDPDAVVYERLISRLGALEYAGNETRVSMLREANATAAALIASHKMLMLRRNLSPDLQSKLSAELERLQDLNNQAGGLLDKPQPGVEDTSKAMRLIREIEGGIGAIRSILDDGVVVQFFDGAGNKLDTENKAQVIFVATDVSQFTTAFGKLSAAEQDKDDLVNVLQAGQNQSANKTIRRATESQRRVRDIHEKLDIMVSKMQNTPNDVGDLREIALDAAAALADGPSRFNSVEDLDAYLEGAAP